MFNFINNLIRICSDRYVPGDQRNEGNYSRARNDRHRHRLWRLQKFAITDDFETSTVTCRKMERIRHRHTRRVETVPDCQQCGGIIKTATISFGQAMPETEMQAAHDASTDCDLFIAIGSSLTVYPAAGFPVLAKQQGADLIIINHQATDLDPIADLVIPHSIGAVLSAAAELDQVHH